MKLKKIFSLIIFKKENIWNWYKIFCVCLGLFGNSWSGMKKWCVCRVVGKVVWSILIFVFVVCVLKWSL